MKHFLKWSVLAGVLLFALVGFAGAQYLPNLASSQVSVDTTSGGKLIAAARAGRGAVTIINTGTIAVFIGPSGVTTSTGALLPGIAGASITIPTTAAVYGIVSNGSQTVSVLETY
jgi:hypothetical protein